MQALVGYPGGQCWCQLFGDLVKASVGPDGFHRCLQSDYSAESHGSFTHFQFCLFICSCSLVLCTRPVWFTSFSFPSESVLWGPGAAVGAGDHGTGAARERAGHLSPGCHALSFGLFLGQDSRWVLKLDLKEPVGLKDIWMKRVYIYIYRNNFDSSCIV